MDQFYRQPARRKKVSEISREDDIWVRIAGTVVDSSPDVLIIDDGTGVATISILQPGITDGIVQGDFVECICRVIPTDDSYELRSDIVRKIEDRELYMKVVEKVFGNR